MPGLLDVIVGYDCNLWCDYCTITAEMRRRALGGREVATELARGRRQGYDRVSFTGGEPTIRPDLLPLVRRARELGYVDVKVQSNGLLWAEPANVERAVDAGVTTFHVSVHAHRADAYERMVARPGTHASMERGLRELCARGLDPTADLILASATHAHAPEAIDWLADRGVRRVQLWSVSLTDGNRDRFETMPTMTATLPSVRAAFARGDARGVEVRTLHLPRCLLGADADRALDPGAGRVRVVTPEATFELRDSKLTPRVHVSACDGCPHRDACPGVRPDYLERFGDAEVAGARGQAPSLSPTRLPVSRG